MEVINLQEYLVLALANSEEGPIPWFGEDESEQGWFNEASILFNNYQMNGPSQDITRDAMAL